LISFSLKHSNFSFPRKLKLSLLLNLQSKRLLLHNEMISLMPVMCLHSSSSKSSLMYLSNSLCVLSPLPFRNASLSFKPLNSSNLSFFLSREVSFSFKNPLGKYIFNTPINSSWITKYIKFSIARSLFHLRKIFKKKGLLN